jgi:hypothetical protein
MGAHDVLQKSFNREEFLTVVILALNIYDLAREVRTRRLITERLSKRVDHLKASLRRSLSCFDMDSRRQGKPTWRSLTDSFHHVSYGRRSCLLSSEKCRKKIARCERRCPRSTEADRPNVAINSRRFVPLHPDRHRAYCVISLENAEIPAEMFNKLCDDPVRRSVSTVRHSGISLMVLKITACFKRGQPNLGRQGNAIGRVKPSNVFCIDVDSSPLTNEIHAYDKSPSIPFCQKLAFESDERPPNHFHHHSFV